MSSSDVEQLLRAGVRPVVTYAFCGALIFGFAVNKISGAEFIAIAGPIVGFFFRERDVAKSDAAAAAAVASAEGTK